MFTDYHTHTNNSFDSKAVMMETCQKALENGVEQICFTEHFTLNPNVPTYGHMKWEKYSEDIQTCQEAFKNQPLHILKGIELCEPHKYTEEYKQLFQKEHVDFILGSVHNIKDIGLRKTLAKYSRLEAYDFYFKEMLLLVEKADIDCLAHFDLIKRYSKEPFSKDDFEKFEPLIKQILSKAIERGIGIEINTSTVEALNEPMPSHYVLSLYRELGGRILTIGSDSHYSEHIGRGIKEAYALAKECGFTEVSVFENRRATFVSI
jgi:histidinol-phosphatase (PHP family)